MAAKNPTAERPSRAPETYMVDFMRFDVSVIEMIARPLQICLRLQADLIKAAQPLTADWLERRREGTDAALEVLEKLMRCTDLAEATAIQRDWFDATIRRLNSDIGALTAHLIVGSKETAAATRNVIQASSDAIASAQRRPGEKAPQSVAAA